MSELSISTLGNGATLIAEHRPRAATLALGLWVRVGARDEPPGLAGATHLLEHLMFRGRAPGIAGSRTQAIARLGGQVNGGVGREALALQGWVPSAQAGALAELLLDMLHAPALDDESRAAERARIAREARVEIIARDAHAPAVLAHAVPGHALGNPILGDPRTLDALEPAVLRRWWQEHLTGPRVAAIAVGAWDAAALRRACAGLSALPGNGAAGDGAARGSAAEAPIRLPPAPGGAASEPLHPARAGWLLSGPRLGEPDEAAFRLAERWVSTALGAAPFSDPDAELPVETALDFTREASLWSVSVSLPRDALAEAARTLEDQLARLAAEGPDAEVLGRIQAGVLAQLALEADDPPGALARLGEEWAVSGSARHRDALARLFESVTPDAARGALGRGLASAIPFGWPRP